MVGLSGLSKWARARSAAYLRGRGLVYGAIQEIFPQQATHPGKFALYCDAQPHPKVDVCDGNLGVLADNAFDYLFVGQRRQQIPDPEATFKECLRKLKVGG